MTISPLMAAIGALGGYIVYDKVSHKTSAVAQPNQPQKQPFWTDWLDLGGQPQTGNGPPKSDIGSISEAVNSVAKFGTSLAQYFGTASSHGGGSGGGIGANSIQTGSYGSGAPLGDADGNFGNGGSEPSDWELPSFDG